MSGGNDDPSARQGCLGALLREPIRLSVLGFRHGMELLVHVCDGGRGGDFGRERGD